MKAKLFGLGILSLALALVCGYLGLTLVARDRQIQELTSQLAAPEKPPQALDIDSMITSRKGITLTSRPTKRKLKITCPTCSGEGKHVIGYPGQLDPKFYGCSICRGKGHQVIILNSNEERCSRCQGMGSIGKREKDGVKRMEVWTATLCPSCNATGKTKKI